MSKVDEHAVVLAVDDAARGRLAQALARPEVVSALLVGSQATGRAGPLSDVDVAVWLDPGLDRTARSTLQLQLMSTASRALGTDEVEVIMLNDASPVARHRAIRDGVRLLDNDSTTRTRLEAAAILEYLDTAPLRATLAAGLRQRIAEGRYGRR